MAGATPVAGTAPSKPFDQPKKRTLKKEDLDALKYQQSVDPDSIELISGNKDSDYEFPEIEKNMVHVEMEQRVFDQQTGAKRSTPHVQKFWPQEYADAVERNGFVGETIKILHKPDGLDEIEQLKAKRKQAKAQR